MTEEQNLPPVADPNVISVIATLKKCGATLDRAISEVARRIVADLKIEAGTHEPFRIGNEYRTQGGEVIIMCGYGSEELAGTSYETMYDQHGVHRYTNQGPASGRCTGSNHEWSDPRNVMPLYARPPTYAVPPLTVVIPEGYKLVKNTTWVDRAWPAGSSGHGSYQNDCTYCGRPFQGHKRQSLCHSCSTETPLKIVPTAIRGESGPDIMISNHNYVQGRVSGGSFIGWTRPKANKDKTVAELATEVGDLTQELTRRTLGDPAGGLTVDFNSYGGSGD